MSKAKNAFDRMCFNYGLDELSGYKDIEYRSDLNAIGELMNCQLNEDEIQEIIYYVTDILVNLEKESNSKKSVQTKQILISAKEKLLLQLKIKGD